VRYTIRHVTHFTYDHAITESVMEVRMQPRSEGGQRCLRFGLGTVPAARVMMYQDHDGNIVHHFNIPGRHSTLTLTTDALVDCESPPPLPEALDLHAWERIDAMTASGDSWEYLAPSTFPAPTPLLLDFARSIALTREHDPLTVLRRTAAEVFTRLEYSPRSTRVDSPIDEALTARRGVSAQ
jgi:transglutaminase-like putative cysteine protease